MNDTQDEIVWNKNFDTYYNKHTFRAALLAAEASRLSAQKVLQGYLKNAFVVSRPPGHHAQATNDEQCGFCFFNNVVVACEELK